MRVAGALRDYGVVVALVVLVIVNAVLQPGHFLSPENLRNLLNQNASVGMIAIGMTLVIVGGGIDLSVGSLAALASVLGLHAINRLVPNGEVLAVGVGVATAALAGVAGGAINGLIVNVGRVTPFIATLCGLVGYRSIALVLADGGELRSSSQSILPALGQGGLPVPFLRASSGNPIEITWNIMVFVLIALFSHFLLERTVFGRNIVAVGENEEAAYLAGIDPRRVRFWTYALLGLFVGIAGIGLTGRMNSVSSSQMGVLYELDAIAAVAIGGTSIAGGQGRVWGTVAGILILGIISNMLVGLGVSPYWQGLVKGGIILLAVLIQRRTA
ncbi:MAG: ABC transporter permease [Fimbriimonadaceae bacterium]|nr:ABC transporter permease [Fimbriimonadaceae bacterium]QYK55593.1 MAG: ABC transporter permease [Fimbriimonadaceae bacterium]